MTEDLAQEEFCALTLRVGEEIIGNRTFNDLALIHENHQIGNRASEAHFVSDADHRHALLGEFNHHVQNFCDHLRIKCRGWFVKQHDLGVHTKRPSDCDPLLLPS